MRILAVVHMYPPRHGAGAERMLHSILRAMKRRGHECVVLASRTPREYTLDGVAVRYLRPGSAERLAEWSDVVVTHLDETQHAAALAARASRPLVQLVHNDRQLEWWGHVGDLAIFNSEWLAAACQGAWRKASIIVPPPVDADDYRTPHPSLADGGRVLLVNVSDAKGSDVFYACAALLPGVPFLGVLGAYNAQEPPPRSLPNLTLEPNTPRMRSVYARTALIVVPSRYESWGRVAVEAAVSGIPVLAAPTPGLRESMGDAAIFLPRDDAAAWARTIACLRDDEAAYACWSRAARARAAALDPERRGDYDRAEKALLALAPSAS